MTEAERFLAVTDDGALVERDEEFVVRNSDRRECDCEECQDSMTFMARCELCLVHHDPEVHESCPFCTCPDCGAMVDPWVQARTDQSAYDEHVCGADSREQTDVQKELDAFTDGGSEWGHAHPGSLRGPPVPREERGGAA